MADGVHYTRKMEQNIVKFTLLTGERVDTLFDASSMKGMKDGSTRTNVFDGEFNTYSLSDDEQKILIKADLERIYRRSSRAHFYVYDSGTGNMDIVYNEGKIMHCTFSPDGLSTLPTLYPIRVFLKEKCQWSGFKPMVLKGKMGHG